MTDRLVHVVDDDPGVLRSIGRLLKSAGYRVALYPSATALLAHGQAMEPGCILIDMLMPDIDGLSLLEELRRRHVELPAIVMTGETDADRILQATQLGAAGFLEKPFGEEDLLDAIQMAYPPAAPQLDGENQRDTIEDAVSRMEALSTRERQVLIALARGETQKVIAFDLGISVRTVEVHRARMLRRLGFKNVAQAIRLAVIAELGSDGPPPPDES
ncbi:MAG: LuxR family two component transcriptional regulator [Devosia sp.]|uniref:response regulator transcription factor n=1 Tax=Devosia sp. TaxID=1871048 RepID=UPI0026312E04|nr:response regulator [Devosia sp.]MDB5542522.1 LuxR family two component transcriptional regulator [Devosia sp.]